MENRYLFPSLMLALILGIFGIFALKSHKALMNEQSELSANVEQLKEVSSVVSLQKGTLAQMKAASTPANNFMTQWRTALAGAKDGNAMLTDLSRFGTDETISVQGRKSGASDYLWKGKPTRVQFAESVGVSGEYYRLVNWLGVMERAWPLARFEQIAFEQKGTSLQLSLKLSYPSFLNEAVAQ